MAGGTGALFCSGVPLRLIPGQAAWLVGLHNLPVIYSATSNHENQESGKRCGPVLSTLGVGGERVVRRAAIAVARSRSRSGGGLSLRTDPHSRWHMESVGGTPVASLAPVRDYYSRASFLARLDRPLSARLSLRVSYVD